MRSSKKIKHSFGEIPVFDSRRNDSIFKATFGTFGLFWLWWKVFDRELLASSLSKGRLLIDLLLKNIKPAASDIFVADYQIKRLGLIFAKVEMFLFISQTIVTLMVFFSETFFRLLVFHKCTWFQWEFDGRLQAYICGIKNFESGDEPTLKPFFFGKTPLSKSWCKHQKEKC